MIVTLEELESIRSQNPNARIVLVSGTFDILHRGHLDYLNWAATKGDILVVAVSDDTSVKEHKGSDRPVNSEEDRLYLLDSLDPVDYCVLVDKYYGIMEETGSYLQPDVFAVFNDWVPSNIDKL